MIGKLQHVHEQAECMSWWTKYSMLTALEQLRSAAPLHGLSQVLLGQRPPSPPENVSDLQFFDESLNESQKDAVRFALGAHEIALVHGPPGVMYPIHNVIMLD